MPSDAPDTVTVTDAGLVALEPPQTDEGRLRQAAAYCRSQLDTAKTEEDKTLWQRKLELNQTQLKRLGK